MPTHLYFQKSPRVVIAVQIGRGAILTNQLHVTSKLVRGVFIAVPPVRLHAILHNLKGIVLVLRQPTNTTMRMYYTGPLFSAATCSGCPH
jgi:hypothetical protein